MNKITSSLIVPLLSLAFLFPIKSLTVVAQEFTDFFESPRLVRSSITYSSRRAWSKYNFFIDIPPEAEKNLSKIVISHEANIQYIDRQVEIYPEETEVFLLTKPAAIISTPNAEVIPIAHSTKLTIDKSNDMDKLVINLAEPIPPDSSIKIVLKASNPSSDGTIKYGVTVYPEGNNPRSIDIGVARFRFGYRR